MLLYCEYVVAECIPLNAIKQNFDRKIGQFHFT